MMVLKYNYFWVMCSCMNSTGFAFVFLLQLGVTKTSDLVNVVEFFTNHIVPDLQAPNGKYLIEIQMLRISIEVRERILIYFFQFECHN